MIRSQTGEARLVIGSQEGRGRPFKGRDLARRKESAPVTSISATPSERHPPTDSFSRVIAMRAARRQLEHRSLLSGDSPGARSAPLQWNAYYTQMAAGVVRHKDRFTVDVFK